MNFNSDIELRLFTASDAFDIVVRPEDEHIKASPYFKAWAEANEKGAGFTGIRKSDGKILGCGGIKVLWPGCGEAWAIYSDEIGSYTKDCRNYAIYYLSELLKALELHRLQCVVDAEDKVKVRFAKSLGFEWEGVMKAYQPDGKDSVMLAYVPREVKPLQLQVDHAVFAAMSLRDKMQAIEGCISTQPQAMTGDCWPLKHSFAQGLYVRQITVPAGVLLTGKIHKFSHAFFLMKGDISILMDGYVKRLKAPCSFITPAGTKRVVYHHADTVVTTVHATEETDLEEIEAQIVAPSWAEFDTLQIGGGL